MPWQQDWKSHTDCLTEYMDRSILTPWIALDDAECLVPKEKYIFEKVKQKLGKLIRFVRDMIQSDFPRWVWNLSLHKTTFGTCDHLNINRFLSSDGWRDSNVRTGTQTLPLLKSKHFSNSNFCYFYRHCLSNIFFEKINLYIIRRGTFTPKRN